MALYKYVVFCIKGVSKSGLEDPIDEKKLWLKICVSITSYLRVIVDDVMMDKAKAAFIERLEKRRANEKLVKEEKKVLAEVIEFSKYKK